MSELSDKEKAQRRARLEGAITPQGSGGYARQREVYRKPITAPSWQYWPAERKVEQWQVVSLSLGLDPDSLEHRGDFITAESFPDADTQDEFRKRIDLLGALCEEVCAPLSLFVGKLRIFPMPPELAALNLATQVPATIETAAGNVPIVDAGGTASDAPPLLKKATTAKPATQEEIIKAFPIKRGWGDKLKKAPSGAYQWLAGTWAHVGSKKPGDATTYYPVKVAVAIAASNPQRMTLAACDLAIKNHFPEWWGEWETESELLRKI